ncbi:hypothetical protein BN1708_006890 [Verticillium longisporum]|uniref:J domain-containing protein n=1 Tax=Verticillium longisporum TaxID=100787 RepID=A0A0G4MPE8_VERLO|nr:hypothetical protein BN1708_006890 [Verticillium longisporum]
MASNLASKTLYSSCLLLSNPTTSITSSCKWHTSTRGTGSQQLSSPLASQRSYATAHDSHAAHHRWPSHSNPTPYDIFAIDKATPYTKARFYELVKLYHPDTHPREGGHAAPRGLTGLPVAVRLERAMQASRAGESAAHVVEQRGLQELAINEALRRQGRETAGKGREERIEKFLRERDGWAFDVAAANHGAITPRKERHD